ncbi:MAG: HAD-IB family phosphatase [Chloroflexi bacterium]|nr:HAD-IB family phosphatase [Chloroflexota bacterium]
MVRRSSSSRRSMLKLAVFDLDGTLKPLSDPYTYLHRRLGVLDEAEAFTAKGFRGEITYEEWLHLDVNLWRGAPRSLLEETLREVPYLPGARETISSLQARGATVAIISSGLLLHAELVAAELGIGPVIGNEILFAGDGHDAVVSGARVHVPYNGKGAVMERLQAQLNVTPAQCLAVGDGSGDIPLFERAAVGVAVGPRNPKVAAAADIVLPESDLRPLLNRLHRHAPHLWS